MGNIEEILKKSYKKVYTPIKKDEEPSAYQPHLDVPRRSQPTNRVEIEKIIEIPEPSLAVRDRGLTVGEPFNPLEGIDAFDAQKRNITHSVEVFRNEVNTSVPDLYNVVYKVKDSDGAVAYKAINVFVRGTQKDLEALIKKQEISRQIEEMSKFKEQQDKRVEHSTEATKKTIKHQVKEDISDEVEEDVYKDEIFAPQAAGKHLNLERITLLSKEEVDVQPLAFSAGELEARREKAPTASKVNKEEWLEPFGDLIFEDKEQSDDAQQEDKKDENKSEQSPFTYNTAIWGC